MFNCYAHGWSHIEKPCPLCCPMHTYSNSSTTIDMKHALKQKEVPELKLWRCQTGYTENGNWVAWGTIRAMYTPASDNWVEFTEDLKKILGVEK